MKKCVENKIKRENTRLESLQAICLSSVSKMLLQIVNLKNTHCTLRCSLLCQEWQDSFSPHTNLSVLGSRNVSVNGFCSVIQGHSNNSYSEEKCLDKCET